MIVGLPFHAIDQLLEQRADRPRFLMCLASLAIAQYTGLRWLYTDGGVGGFQNVVLGLVQRTLAMQMFSRCTDGLPMNPQERAR